MFARVVELFFMPKNFEKKSWCGILLLECASVRSSIYGFLIRKKKLVRIFLLRVISYCGDMAL